MRQEFIEVFLEIAKTRNLTKAAENLHLSQSAVSQTLKLLEQELGAQLVLRHKGQRIAELTCHGEAFVPLAENWMRLLLQTGNLKHLPSNEITIGSVDSLNSNILSVVCQRLLQEQESLRLRICTDQSLQLYKLAENREIDLGFVSYQATFPHVTVRPAFEQVMLVVRNCQDGKHGSFLHPTDLRAEDEIRLNWGQRYLTWHNLWWDQQAKPHVITDSMILLRHFLNTPGCWAVVPWIDFMHETDLPLEYCDFGVHNPPNRIVYMIEPEYIHPNREASVVKFKKALETLVRESPALQ